MAGDLPAHIQPGPFLIGLGPEHSKVSSAGLGHPVVGIHGRWRGNLKIGPQVRQPGGQALAHDEAECLSLHIEAVLRSNF